MATDLKLNPKWTLITIVDPAGLPGKSIFDAIQLMIGDVPAICDSMIGDVPAICDSIFTWYDNDRGRACDLRFYIHMV